MRHAVLDGTLGDAGFLAVPLFGRLPWREAALHRPADGTLVVSGTLVTAADLTGPGERLAVTPYARLLPPRAALAGLDVARVLVGHGRPVLADAGAALTTALADARRGAPAAVLGTLPYLLRAAAVALRDRRRSPGSNRARLLTAQQ